MVATTTSDSHRDGGETGAEQPQATATTEYCAKLQQWMWQYYWGHANWQSWVALSAFPFPPPCAFPPPGTSAHTPAAPASSSGGAQQPVDTRSWYSYPHPLSFPVSSTHQGGVQAGQSSAATAAPGTGAQQQNGNPPQAGKLVLCLTVSCSCRQHHSSLCCLS